MMKVVIEILTGRFLHVDIDESAILGDLKKEIAVQEAIPEHRVILVHSNGCHLMMDDQKSLSDYGVQEGSHIYLFFTTVQPTTPSQDKETVQ
ncbi:hypothetical protein MRB53_029230 [Persea americana]|uniref:Uncharacterized protein n=1 Tax=Persea americana TaxID=3435 RepID=A0ACC2KHY5_PERAE|nr:hypothetical protein MRB53_029230 [Persea americana]